MARQVDLVQYLNDQAVAPPSAETKRRLRAGIAALSDRQFDALCAPFVGELRHGLDPRRWYTREQALEDLVERPVPARFLSEVDRELAELVAHNREARLMWRAA
jgi:hypothetical protein